MSGPQLIVWDSGRTEPIVARVAIGGDFLPGGAIILPRGGLREASRALAPVVDDVTLAFVNLECTLDSEKLSARPLEGLGDIVSAPSASLDYLAEIRCRIVSLANNHSYDFGAAGVERTCRAIVRAGITPLGARTTLRSAPDTFVWSGPADVRIGFWAAARASRDLAARERKGVEPATVARAATAHQALASTGAKFSVALLHAGCHRTDRPDPSDAKIMDSIARTGFQMVAASHSHRISGAKLVEVSSDGPFFCFYGLGSIASGFVASPLEREGLIVVAAFHASGTLARVELRPVLLGQDGFGAVTSPEESRLILDRFRRLSQEFADGSASRLFYKDFSCGLANLYLRDASAAFRSAGLRGLMHKAGRLRIAHVRRLIHGLLG